MTVEPDSKNSNPMLPWAALVRLIAVALTFLWVILAFARNPVAH